MKKNMLIFGYVLFVSGIVLFGLMHVAIALYIPDLAGDMSGKLAFVLNEIVGWVPYILSIVFILVGLFIVIYDLVEMSSKD